MLSEQEIISTFEMVRNENLDIRTLTLGINLFDCLDSDIEALCDKIYNKIVSKGKNLVQVCDEIGDKYGIKVVNKRVAVSPISLIGGVFSESDMIKIAKTLDNAAKSIGIDFIGGYSALVEKGITKSDRTLISSVPEALSVTERVCCSVNVASTKAGINFDAINLMAKTIKEAAWLSKEKDGISCAKICVFANIPPDVPFMAGAYLGIGEADCVINVGVSGPGVIKNALQRALKNNPKIDLGRLSEIIKRTAFKITRVGELIGREVAEVLNVKFGIVDLSLAPTPNVGDSVGEIFEVLGLGSIGDPGSTALLAMLNDAVKKGGAFASSYVGGLSGAFIPVCEDLNIAQAVEKRRLSLEKLEAMTSVCSVGLDMIPIPGDTPWETIAAIIADEMAIGVINNKSTAVRIIPVPNKKPGDKVKFGGLLGEAPVLEIRKNLSPNEFVKYGGIIPAPVQSLTN